MQHGTIRTLVNDHVMAFGAFAETDFTRIQSGERGVLLIAAVMRAPPFFLCGFEGFGASFVQCGESGDGGVEFVGAEAAEVVFGGVGHCCSLGWCSMVSTASL